MRYSGWCPGLDAGSPVAGPGRLACSTAWWERGGVVRRCTSVPAWRHALEAAEHALAEAQAVRKQAETAPNGANDRLNELERDLDEARAAGTLPAVPGMRPGWFLVSHVPSIWWSADDLRPLPPSTSSACTARPRSTTPSGGLTAAATQTLQHRPTSTAERLRAQGEGRHYSTFSLYPPQELRAAIAPSWPACRP